MTVSSWQRPAMSLLSRDQINEKMNVLLGGLDRMDAEMVVEHAAAIARKRAGAKFKEAAALEAFGRRKGV